MRSTQRPDTLAQDQITPSSPISLATHRRSIHPGSKAVQRLAWTKQQPCFRSTSNYRPAPGSPTNFRLCARTDLSGCSKDDPTRLVGAGESLGNALKHANQWWFGTASLDACPRRLTWPRQGRKYRPTPQPREDSQWARLGRGTSYFAFDVLLD